MRKATRIVAASLGVAAGIAGLEHGYFEILQGNTRPEGLMIVSMGSPCVPEEIWCERSKARRQFRPQNQIGQAAPSLRGRVIWITLAQSGQCQHLHSLNHLAHQGQLAPGRHLPQPFNLQFFDFGGCIR
jgi:hypothetical protein